MKDKLKKIFNLYNLAITVCVIMIISSLIVIFEPNFGDIISKTNTSNQEEEKIEISEEKAVKLAKNQFKELGEKDIQTNDFEVLKINRDGEEYYYISSKENTVEIKIDTGEITRVNSVKVK